MKKLTLFLLALLVMAAAPDTVFAAPASKAAATKTPADPGWPREITKDGIRLTVYQPQIDEWKDFRTLKARAAIVLTAKDGKPVAGVVELGGQTTTDAAARTVLIRDLKITAARFPSMPEASVPPTESMLKQTFPERSLTVSLDRLAAGAERKKKDKPLKLKMDPPQIFVCPQAAILLVVEGKPVLAPIAGTDVQFVVNTNWDLLFDKAGETYYLLVDNAWYSTKTPGGQWALVDKVPASFSRLPKGDQWDHVKRAIPARIELGLTIPAIYYSEKPAELIQFNGNPVWEEIENTQLMWAKNTESWVFENTQDRQLYYLTSGRWFRAQKWEGPWTYAGNDLPADFKLIPPDSACADVLSSVPGTPEAADAVLLAQVPNEAVVKRAEVEKKAAAVYDGEPKFAPVEGTQMTYATNTSSDVIQVDGKFYLCQDAVWFVGPSANGPWTVCTEVPEAIYTIPPENPEHHVTYVETESGETDDTAVCSYTDGYYGEYVSDLGTDDVLWWGTGYYYSPYVYWEGDVPIYRPWPATYGAAAAYNPWTGCYALGGAIYGPYAAAGRAAWYNPATGSYGRAARVEGPYGSRTVAAGYNPRTDTAWRTRQSNNGYAQWGTSAASRGDDWIRAGHVATNDDGAARWKGSEGGGRVWKGDDHGGGVARHDGNVYAGRDGNVYRRDDNGNWAKYDNGDWDSIDAKDKLHDSRGRYQQQSANRNAIANSTAGANRPSMPDRLANADRHGASGGGVQRNDIASFEDRAAARRAEIQPGADVLDSLDRESFNRQRSDFHVQQQQSFQPVKPFQPQQRPAYERPAYQPQQQRQAFDRPAWQPQQQQSFQPQRESFQPQQRQNIQRSAPSMPSSRSFSGGGGRGGGMRRR